MPIKEQSDLAAQRQIEGLALPDFFNSKQWTLYTTLLIAHKGLLNDKNRGVQVRKTRQCQED